MNLENLERPKILTPEQLWDMSTFASATAKPLNGIRGVNDPLNLTMAGVSVNHYDSDYATVYKGIERFEVIVTDHIEKTQSIESWANIPYLQVSEIADRRLLLRELMSNPDFLEEIGIDPNLYTKVLFIVARRTLNGYDLLSDPKDNWDEGLGGIPQDKFLSFKDLPQPMDCIRILQPHSNWDSREVNFVTDHRVFYSQLGVNLYFNQNLDTLGNLLHTISKVGSDWGSQFRNWVFNNRAASFIEEYERMYTIDSRSSAFAFDPPEHIVIVDCLTDPNMMEHLCPVADLDSDNARTMKKLYKGESPIRWSSVNISSNPRKYSEKYSEDEHYKYRQVDLQVRTNNRKGFTHVICRVPEEITSGSFSWLTR